jgi:hypothetical protein
LSFLKHVRYAFLLIHDKKIILLEKWVMNMKIVKRSGLFRGEFEGENSASGQLNQLKQPEAVYGNNSGITCGSK